MEQGFDFLHTPGLYNVKSPLNYVGGKFRLLNVLLQDHVDIVSKNAHGTMRKSLIPKDIVTFVDVFCGGFNVGANTTASSIIGIDMDKDVLDLLMWMRDTPSEKSTSAIRDVILNYGLGNGKKSDQTLATSAQETAYYALRKEYNEARLRNESYLGTYDIRSVLYVLIVHGFNSHIRFGPNGYNIPFGERTFNPSIERNFIEFSDRLALLQPTFLHTSFTAVEQLGLGVKDYLYFDPPYLITTAPYNENVGWGEQDDKNLYTLLDTLHEQGLRWGISNVIEARGKTNTILSEWAKKYTVHDIAFDYNHASYNLKEREEEHVTREVFVTNV